MNDETAFRKRKNDFSTRDISFSEKDKVIRKNNRDFSKKEVKLKKESLFNVIEKDKQNKEADNDVYIGSLKGKKSNKKYIVKNSKDFRIKDVQNEEESADLNKKSDKDTFTSYRKQQERDTKFRVRKNTNFTISDGYDKKSTVKKYSFTTYPNTDYFDVDGYNHRENMDYNINNNEFDRNYPESKRIKRSKKRMIINRAKQHEKRNIKKISSYINNSIDNESDLYNPEYEGNSNIEKEFVEKNLNGIIHTIGVATVAVIKVFVSALTSLLGWIGIAAFFIIGGTVIVVQNITYDFIVDEDKFFRENISQISSEFTEEITSYANENGCTRIVVSGELTDWKNVIAFFWTLRNNYSKHEQYSNTLSGDDYSDLKEIFNEFNEVSYEIEETNEEKVLKVSINNKSIEEMEKKWFFSSEQKMYLENLIATDELWEEILGMNGLAVLAYSELGQTAERYYGILSLSEGDDWSIAFIYYLLNENGYVGNDYIRKTSSIDAFRQYCSSNDWLTVFPQIGDIAFINLNGDNRLGIISNIEDDYIYIILGNYDRSGIVKEIYVSKTSGILTGMYVHINMPDAIQAINFISMYAVGNGECLWPVPGKYYVTSPYGARWGTVHKGMDISCPEGTPVVAAKSGTVSLSYRSSSAGEYIVLDHGDGMCTEYMHNSLRLVSAGEHVEAGQVIAYSGNTGQSTGPHCHFGVRINGERVDPAPYLGIPSQIGDVSEYVTGE